MLLLALSPAQPSCLSLTYRHQVATCLQFYNDRDAATAAQGPLVGEEEEKGRKMDEGVIAVERGRQVKVVTVLVDASRMIWEERPGSEGEQQIFLSSSSYHPPSLPSSSSFPIPHSSAATIDDISAVVTFL